MSSKMLKVYQLSKSTNQLLYVTPSTMTLNTASSPSNHSLRLQPHQMVRLYSNRPKGILGGFIDTLKEEFNKNKEMKDEIKKFREEREKLEKSDALKEARSKFKSLEEETNKGTKFVKETLDTISEQVKKSDIGKSAAEFTTKIGQAASENISELGKKAEEFAKTEAFKKVSETASAIKDKVDQVAHISDADMYYKPERKLRMRSTPLEGTKVFEENTEAQGVVLHKDSAFFQSWQNFKENNKYVNKLFDLKAKVDESDNPLAAGFRFVSDKLGSVFGGITRTTEMSQVISEIVKMEPDFSTDSFLKHRVQQDIVPNVLEAVSQQDLKVLEDWCSQSAFSIFSFPIKQCQLQKMKYYNKVLDTNSFEIVTGKIMEQGPVLVVSFVAQQIIYITDEKGFVVEGKKEQVQRVQHVWALGRDQSIMDPMQAWRVMECAMHAQDMLI